MTKNGDLSPMITRIEDLPYKTSPPAQFVFTQAATLTAGTYPWTGGRAAITNEKDITDNTLIYIKALSFSADIPLVDYQQALKLAAGTVDIPRFSAFLQADSNAPIFVDPIVLHDYFNDQEYRLLIEPKQLPNAFTGFFRGTLQQTAALAGVGEINLTVQMWVQLISDDNFIAGIRKEYPRVLRS